MDTSISTTKEPGQRNWTSALSRIPEPFRSAMAEHAKMQKHQKKCMRPSLNELEQSMLPGGRALSLITYAGFIPYHLISEEETQDACAELLENGPESVMTQLKDRIRESQVLLFIGDDPVAESFDRAIAQCKAENGYIKSLIAGPGNLMENALRKWSIQNNWPDTFLHVLDGSGGEVWRAQTDNLIDNSVEELFSSYLPTKIVLLQPVRLPATQACIEYAMKNHIPMLTIQAYRLTSNPR